MVKTARQIVPKINLKFQCPYLIRGPINKRVILKSITMWSRSKSYCLKQLDYSTPDTARYNNLGSVLIHPSKWFHHTRSLVCIAQISKAKNYQSQSSMGSEWGWSYQSTGCWHYRPGHSWQWHHLHPNTIAHAHRQCTYSMAPHPVHRTHTMAALHDRLHCRTTICSQRMCHKGPKVLCLIMITYMTILWPTKPCSYSCLPATPTATSSLSNVPCCPVQCVGVFQTVVLDQSFQP